VYFEVTVFTVVNILHLPFSKNSLSLGVKGLMQVNKGLIS